MPRPVDPRMAQSVLEATAVSLDASVKLLAAGASTILKQVGILGAEQEVAEMLYRSILQTVRVVRQAEKERRRNGDGPQREGG